MEYQDFTIDIQSTLDGRFEARAIDEASRELRPVIFDRPIDQQRLKLLCGTPAEARADGESVPARPPSPPTPEVGRLLYSAVFREALEGLLSERLAALSPASSGLRIRLRFRRDDTEAEYLATLPWEWLWNPQKDTYFSSDPHTPVIRDFLREGSASTDIFITGRPLRILIVESAPITAHYLKVKWETNRIFKALAPLEKDGHVELIELKRNTIADFRGALLEGPIHVLHFMGHGGYNKASGFGALFFERLDGRAEQVGGIALAEHLKCNESLRLVVLNACWTARYAGRVGPPHYSGVASAILERTGIPAVVANQHAISDQTAISFSKVFYEHLAKGARLEEAVTGARCQLRREGTEWATPVLFFSAQDGKLLDGAKATPSSTKPVRERFQHDETPIRLGIRSFDGWGGDMEAQFDAILDFLPYFDHRYIRNEEWWQKKILPELRSFLLKHSASRRPLILDFAAHASIAFAAGWILSAKSGLDIRIAQREMTRRESNWHPKEGEIPEGPLWLDNPDVPLASEGSDIALALAATHSTVPEEAQAFIERRNLPVRRLLTAAVAPAPGQASVWGGAHSLALAQALLPTLRQRYPEERGKHLHVFAAAPNALLFYLGQLARPLGKIRLYEYAFGAEDAYSRYNPSIELPDPGERQPIPWKD